MLKKFLFGGFIALFCLSLLPLTASATFTIQPGSLLKASGPGIYYYGADSKRYIFPNEKTYLTWFASYDRVTPVSDSALASIAIGGNITYKPGVKMIKITTDPKVYYIEKNGLLRWIKTEALAEAIYGSYWREQVEDVPDAFFVSYMIGAPITTPDITPVPTGYTINQDRGLSNLPDPTLAQTSKISLTGNVSENSATSAELKWTASNISTPEGFIVIKSTVPNPVPPGNETHTISNPSAFSDKWENLTGSTYYFRVCQIIEGQCGVYSNNLILLPGLKP